MGIMTRTATKTRIMTVLSVGLLQYQQHHALSNTIPINILVDWRVSRDDISVQRPALLFDTVTQVLDVPDQVCILRDITPEVP